MLFLKIKKNVSEKLATVSFFLRIIVLRAMQDPFFMKLSLKYTCSNYCKSILKVERGKGMLELSTLYFSQSFHCKILQATSIQCSRALCMKLLISYYL